MARQIKLNNIHCLSCGTAPLTKNEIGLNKKLLDAEAKTFYCLPCLAEFLEVTEEELQDKVREFKSEGCVLFS